MILAFDLWSTIISILAFVFALGLIILIHEGGHFFFARRANILCREYAFGMGPLLWKKKKGETLYSLRALPIGGFCAIAGEEVEEDPLKELRKVKFIFENGKVKKIICTEDSELFKDLKSYELVSYDLFDANDTGKLFIKVLDGQTEIEFPVDPQAYYVFAKPVKNNKLSKEKQLEKYTEETQIAPHNRTLNAKTKRQRAMVMFGGILMNFVLAIVVFFFAGLLLGFADTSTTTLGEVIDGNPSYVAGLQEDDVILELSSGSLSSGTLTDWNSLSKFMDDYRNSKNVEELITVKYLRDDKEYTTTVKPMVVIYSISMVQDITSEDVKIAELSQQSLAYKAGLRKGDIIKAIKYEGESFDYVQINNWKEVHDIFYSNINGDPMTLKVLRDGKEVECSVDPYSKEVFDKTQSVDITTILIGVSPKTKFSVGKSIVYPFTEFYNSLKKMINTLGMLFSSKEIGIGDLSGPVGIFQLTSEAAKGGFASLLNFIGFLSVNVGFMNLLPIPALDGGRLVFVAYEAITKKKPNQKVETVLITVTMLLLFGLIIFVSFNDILRLLGVK